jgi:hypothetical protein
MASARPGAVWLMMKNLWKIQESGHEKPHLLRLAGVSVGAGNALRP